MRAIDLNADLGESFGAWTMGDDEALLDVVTSANVACGFHAGDPSVMWRTLTGAARRGVVVGAHVAYRDLAGFGRRFIEVARDELRADVLYQLSAIAGMARSAGAQLGYVKPHGALYNAIVHHRGQATAVVEALAQFGQGSSGQGSSGQGSTGLGSTGLGSTGLGSTGQGTPLVLLGLPGVALDLAREAGLSVAVEAFADRGYRADGTLVPRSEPGALLHDADEVAARMTRLATQGVLTAVDGTEITVAADSICVHGDSPGAVAMATKVRAELTAAGVEVAPFVPTTRAD